MVTSRRPCDLIVRDARLLLPETETGILTGGAIAIRDGRIVDIGSTPKIDEGYKAGRNIDADGAIIHAGLIEPHLHLSQYVSRGIHHAFSAAGRPDLAYAAWKAAITPEEEHRSSAVACLELAKAGYTGVVDPGTIFSPADAAGAAQAVGIRCWLAHPYLWDRHEGDIGGLVSNRLLDRVPAEFDRCDSALSADAPVATDDLIRSHVAIYGENTASDSLWTRAAAAAARRNDQTLTAHLGFDPAISRTFRETHGISQLRHLDQLGVLGPSTTLVHLNDLDDDDLELLLSRQCRAIWCPANAIRARAGGGQNRLAELSGRGGVVGLGMDMPQVHAIGEIGTVAALAAENAQPGARELFRMMTDKAAATIGADDVGRLAIGQSADIVIRRSVSSEICPGVDPYGQVVLHGRAEGVRSVLVRGDLVVHEGQSTRVDETRIRRRGAETAHAIMERIGFFARPVPFERAS